SQGGGQTNVGTVGTGPTLIGNASGSTTIQGATYATTTNGVCIVTAGGSCGSGGTSPVLLELFQANTFAETANTCTSAVNPGGMYYNLSTSGNTSTQELRGCVGGAWRDIITSDQLGVILL